MKHFYREHLYFHYLDATIDSSLFLPCHISVLLSMGPQLLSRWSPTVGYHLRWVFF